VSYGEEEFDTDGDRGDEEISDMSMEVPVDRSAEVEARRQRSDSSSSASEVSSYESGSSSR
jgi:hypothetical protein